MQKNVATKPIAAWIPKPAKHLNHAPEKIVANHHKS
jgi:hypothetical protein